MRSRYELACLPLLVAVCLAFPNAAAAHGGNDDPQAVHACVNDKTLVVRIRVEGTCTNVESRLHWSIRGPKGAPGINGINGANGINGTDGTSITVRGLFEGSRNRCPNGGLILASGVRLASLRLPRSKRAACGWPVFQ